MAESPQRFVERLSYKLGTLARDAARNAARSDTIGESLFVNRLSVGEVAVESPYYWARWYHDGRGAIRARPGHKLVYFRTIEQDPRIRGRRYPKRPEDVVRLTRAQFYSMLRDPGSGMIVRDSVGPAAGDPFFDRIGRVFPVRAARESQAAFSSFVKDFLGPEILDAKVTTRFVI